VTAADDRDALLAWLAPLGWVPSGTVVARLRAMGLTRGAGENDLRVLREQGRLECRWCRRRDRYEYRAVEVTP
jgi:hypothetical protein